MSHFSSILEVVSLPQHAASLWPSNCLSIDSIRTSDGSPENIDCLDNVKKERILEKIELINPKKKIDGIRKKNKPRKQCEREEREDCRWRWPADSFIIICLNNLYYYRFVGSSIGGSITVFEVHSQFRAWDESSRPLKDRGKCGKTPGIIHDQWMLFLSHLSHSWKIVRFQPDTPRRRQWHPRGLTVPFLHWMRDEEVHDRKDWNSSRDVRMNSVSSFF